MRQRPAHVNSTSPLPPSLTIICPFAVSRRSSDALQPPRGDPNERGDPRGGELALSEAGACLAYGGDGSVPGELWDQYASSRPHVASSAAAEAATAIVRNARSIVQDAESQCALPIGTASKDYDLALRAVVAALLENEGELRELQQAKVQVDSEAFSAVAAYLDDRICVPRDVGAPAAAAIRALQPCSAGDTAKLRPGSRSVNNF